MMLRRHAAVPAALALLLGACSDSGTGPGDRDQGQLDVSASRTALTIAPAGQDALVRCDLTIRARRADDADGPITIDRLVLRFHLGFDRETPFDSLSVTDVASVLGARILSGDDEAAATAWFELSAPFEIRGAMYSHDADGNESTSNFVVECGPSFDDVLAVAPPALGDVDVSLTAGDVEAGTPIEVDFSASAAAGLWETWLLVASDAGTDTIRFYEALAAQASHTATVVFPPGASLGSRLSIRAVAWDAALRGTVSAPIESAALIDTIAPTASMGFARPSNCTLVSCQYPPCTPTTCNFHQGFTPHLEIWARDASGFGSATLRFDDLPPIQIPITGVMTQQPITLPAGLTGVVHMTGTVEDVHGNVTEIDLGSATIHAS